MRVALALLVALTAHAAAVPTSPPGRSTIEEGTVPLVMMVEGIDAEGRRTGADFRFPQSMFVVPLRQLVTIAAVLDNTLPIGGGPFDATGVVVHVSYDPRHLEYAAFESERGTVVAQTCEQGATTCEVTVTIGDLAANEEVEMAATFMTVAIGSTEVVFVEEQNEFNPGDQMGTVTVTIEEPPTISGQKWLDLDGDGQRDDDEGPVDGVLVALVDATGTVVAQTTTGEADLDGDGEIDPLDERGIYSFALPETAGAYTVSETLPDGWAAIPAGGVHEVEVDGQTIDGLDFFNDPPPDAEFDFGDLPDTFPTTLAAGGPAHVVLPNGQLVLGVQLDTEDDGVPTPDASGDDLLVPPDQIDDEDGLVGIEFGSGGTGTLTVRTNAAGVLDAWLDVDDSGVFGGPEHIVVAAPVPGAGEHTFSFTIPDGTTRGGHLRLRFHDVPGGLGVGGFALNGEVEDHLVLGLDLGDANQDPLEVIPGMPFGYPVRIAVDGARHLANDLVRLGEAVDAETDFNVSLSAEVGLASNTATGDDNDPDDNQNDGPRDDEDGVAFGDGFVPFTIQLPVGTAEPSAPNPLVRYGLVAGTTGTLTFFPNVDGGLDGWFDWNRDGDWDDEGEHVFANERIGPENPPPTLDVTAPAGAPPGNFHSRFRFSRNGALQPVGLAPDGEVEDYLMATFPPLDYGDAPAPYPSGAADLGARHGVGALWLGAEVDAEAEARDDDADDGVTVPSELRRGRTSDLSVTVGGTAPAVLYTWIDWNGDGDWDDDGEQVTDGVSMAVGAQILSVDVPGGAEPGTTWARFRVSAVPLPFVAGADVDPITVPFVTEGEIEDYTVEIAANAVAGEEDAAPTETAIEAVYPNPARDRLVVDVALATPADVTVRVYDALGRSVLVLAEGARPIGRHALAVDVRQLPAGAYVVAVEPDGVRMTRRVVVVR